MIPQNSPQERDPRLVPNRRLSEKEVARLRKLVEARLRKEDCGKFIEGLLAGASTLRPDKPLISDDVMGMFDLVSAGGGFYVAPTATYSTMGGRTSDGTGGVYFAYDDPAQYPLNPKNYSPRVFRDAATGWINAHFDGMAATAIHELLHHAGYSDLDFARSVAMGRGETVSFSSDWEGTKAASRYWNAELVKHCH